MTTIKTLQTNNTNDTNTMLKTFMEEHCTKTPDKIFLNQPMGGESVQTWTFRETLEEAKKVAGYLESLNLERGSHIAICSKNCAWWLMADIAIWLSGHVSIPIYPTLSSETVSYILEHSETKLLFVGKLDEKPWNAMKASVPNGLPMISFPMKPAGEWGTAWQEIISTSKPIQQPVDRTLDELATIIYTSGSTGMPKGTMISFRAMTHTTKAFVDLHGYDGSDRYLSYLPLSHVLDRFLGECVPLYTGLQLFYCESLDTFVRDLGRCRPTLFVSVPRLWTKFQQGVLSKIPEKKLNLLMSIPIVGYFVKKSILKGLGLDAVKDAGTGSAPITKELLEWFNNLGLNLLEGYGMTENFAYSHNTLPGRVRIGYVGEPCPGVEQRLTEEGELEMKSPGLMMGYYKNEKATKEAITEDGWLRTGDRGEIDELGRFKITGRSKELFKTSKGKYVAPAPIENKLNVNHHIELSCVSGSGQPQPFAMIQLSQQSKKEVQKDLKQQTKLTEDLKAFLKEINKSLDPHEALQCLVIVKKEWQPENGFLTPTQKIKRRVIEEEYKEKVDQWYAMKQTVVWAGW